MVFAGTLFSLPCSKTGLLRFARNDGETRSVVARSAATKQFSLCGRWFLPGHCSPCRAQRLDCFASLAMTGKLDPSLRGAQRRSNPVFAADGFCRDIVLPAVLKDWIASLRSQ